MTKILKKSILLCSLIFSATLFASFGLGVAPTYLELDVEPGKIYRQKITVANMGTNSKLSIVVGSATWNINEDGKIELKAPSLNSEDPNNWLKFTPTSFTLGSQKNMEILVDINVPLDVQKKEYRVALLSSTVLPSQDIMKKSKNVWEKVQVASLMYISTSKDLSSLSSLYFNQNKGKKNLNIEINNAGNKHSRISGVLNFFDGEKKVYSQDLNIVLMPNQKRTIDFKVDIPETFKGKKLKIIPTLNDTMSKDSSVSSPKEIEYGF